MKTRLTLLLPAIVFPAIGWGQIGATIPVSDAKNGTLTSTVYDWEAIGINPANLGWSVNHQFSITLMDVGLYGQSEDMDFSRLTSAMHTSGIPAVESWQNILSLPNGMTADADINWIAASFKVPTVPGAFAVSMRDRIMGNAALSANTTEALTINDTRVFNDAVTMQLLSGTRLHYIHYREFNLDYGSPLLNIKQTEEDESPGIAKCFSFSKRTGVGSDQVALYGGIGIKYLIGYAHVDGNINNGINATYSVANNYPNTLYTFGQAPGHGFAADLGLGAIWKRWTFGWSVTDIGSIKWSHTMTTTGDTNIAAITHGSDVLNELKSGTLGGSQQTTDAVTDLPAKMRFGASYRAGNKWLVSADIITSLNKTTDNLIGPYFALGAQYDVIRTVSLYAGLAYSNGYSLVMPIGATVTVNNHFQFYLGTTDITSYLGRNHNADISAGLWMFRYNF
jgi:hypothetical protein